jgi:hypothetical protein
MLVGVLDHDDGGIDHRANRNGDSTEAHDVGVELDGLIAMNDSRMASGSVMTATGRCARYGHGTPARR